MPPEAVSVCDQALPTVAADSAPDAGDSASAGALTVSATVASAEVPPPFAACQTKLSLPE
ncbi:hypothetical protein F3J36_14805 [Pantoea sp. Cy-640]|nr:hypothetical protein [Pantoea sp. Cy-640]